MKKSLVTSLFAGWKISAAAAILALGALQGCNEPQEPVLKPAQEGVQNDTPHTELIAFLSGETGAPVDRIKFDKKMDAFFIDGDMIVDRKEAELRLAEAKSSRTTHRRGRWLLSDDVAKNVAIYIHPSLEPAWKNAIAGAAAEWNQINYTRLRFSITTNKSAATMSVLPKDDYDDPNVIASMRLPRFDGSVQGDMTVNIDYNPESELPFLKKKFAIAHELGHAVGFTHTDKPSTTNIDYHMATTPTFDPNSVMHSVAQTWKGFSGWDRVATSILYPSHTWVQLPGTARDIAISPGDDESLWVVGDTPIPNSNGY